MPLILPPIHGIARPGVFLPVNPSPPVRKAEAEDAPEAARAPCIRIVLVGGPHSGMTEAASALVNEAALRDSVESGVLMPRLRDTDESKTLPPWATEAGAEVAGWFDAEGPWIVFGLVTARALRTWLGAHAEGKPADVVIRHEQLGLSLTKGEESVRKGIATIWAQVRGELEARGVRIEVR